MLQLTPCLKSFFSAFVDEKIDGSGFLDLTEGDIKSLVSKLGIVKKISHLQKLVSWL